MRSSILPRHRSQQGLSLIELMIAMALGLLVVGAVLQLFIGSKATHMSNEALARVQENGRFSLELLKHDFREVGSHGFCAARMEIRNHLRPDCPGFTDMIFDSRLAFVGWEFVGTGRGEAYTVDDESDLIPTSGGLNRWQSQNGAVTENLSGAGVADIFNGRIVPGSDLVVVRRAEVVPEITANGNTPVNAANINLNGNHGLDQYSIVLVSNCTTGADLFQLGNNPNASTLGAGGGSCTNPGPGNLSMNWSTAYDESMQVFRVVVNGYYIGYNVDRGEPGLYRVRLSNGLGTNARHEELVEGVETMQVLYGYSLPAEQGGDGQTVDFWLAADEVPNWEFVIGARLSLLVRSPEGMADGPVQRAFDLASTAFTHPSDSRLRQPFFASISLRNRQLVL